MAEEETKCTATHLSHEPVLLLVLLHERIALPQPVKLVDHALEELQRSPN